MEPVSAVPGPVELFCEKAESFPAFSVGKFGSAAFALAQVEAMEEAGCWAEGADAFVVDGGGCAWLLVGSELENHGREKPMAVEIQGGYARATRAELSSAIAEIISGEFNVEADMLVDETTLVGDLGMDSLDVTIAAMGIEDALGVVVSDEALDELKTFGQVVDLVLARLREAK
ncbi:MAG: acyl carrier protein [Thermoplasmata archaeon]|nr:acyl carrier protein [Thermoplasmata archaeon]